MEEILVAGAVVYKIRAGKVFWLLVRPNKDEGWQLPKGVVRRGESSVRAAMRVILELVNLKCKVIEEAGRTTVNTTKNGSPMTKKFIFYLIQQRGKSGEEALGVLSKLTWGEFKTASKKLTNQMERKILFRAKITLAEWQKQTKAL